MPTPPVPSLYQSLRRLASPSSPAGRTQPERASRSPNTTRRDRFRPNTTGRVILREDEHNRSGHLEVKAQETEPTCPFRLCPQFRIMPLRVAFGTKSRKSAPSGCVREPGRALRRRVWRRAVAALRPQPANNPKPQNPTAPPRLEPPSCATSTRRDARVFRSAPTAARDGCGRPRGRAAFRKSSHGGPTRWRPQTEGPRSAPARGAVTDGRGAIRRMRRSRKFGGLPSVGPSAPRTHLTEKSLPSPIRSVTFSWMMPLRYCIGSLRVMTNLG